MNYYSENLISNLRNNEIFVFGSNLAGRHGAGAALLAKLKFNAEYGRGEGVTGQCYALPTKDKNIRTLPLNKIEQYIWNFADWAEERPDWIFLVTKIGCGLAGYKDSEIAPMFSNAPSNCWFHKDWFKYLEGEE